VEGWLRTWEGLEWDPKDSKWMEDGIRQTCPRFIPVRTVEVVGIYLKIKKALVSNRT
jgi:hypothetical protein